MLAYNMDFTFQDHRHHHQTMKKIKKVKRSKNITVKPKFFIDLSKTHSQLLDPYEHFRDHLQRLNERFLDDLYFCSSIYKDNSKDNVRKQLWILRNKKCLNFSDTRFNFYKAFELCKVQPYSYNYMVSKSEILFLLNNKDDDRIGIDIYQAYFKLLIAEKFKTKNKKQATNTKVTLWLNDDYLMSQECELHDYAPVIHVDDTNCKNGCFECLPRNSTPGFYAICAKNCNWKVPYNSFCNTMNINEYQLNKNLYFQTDHLIYVCQGNLTCKNYNCECKNGQNYYSKNYCK